MIEKQTVLDWLKSQIKSTSESECMTPFNFPWFSDDLKAFRAEKGLRLLIYFELHRFISGLNGIPHQLIKRGAMGTNRRNHRTRNIKRMVKKNEMP